MPRRRGGMSWKPLLKAAAYGLGISIGGYYAGRAMGRPVIGELGQRGAAVMASKVGGWKGQIAFQLADALFDRGVIQRQLGLTGVQSGTRANFL